MISRGLEKERQAFTRELERERQYAELRRQAAAKRVDAIVRPSVAILEMIWIIMLLSSRALGGGQSLGSAGHALCFATSP
jgi:hypothetical protein